jgi:hypothetical protein
MGRHFRQLRSNRKNTLYGLSYCLYSATITIDLSHNLHLCPSRADGNRDIQGSCLFSGFLPTQE